MAQQLLDVLPLAVVLRVGKEDLVQAAGIVGVAVGDPAALGAGRGQLFDQDFPVVEADVEPAVYKHSAGGQCRLTARSPELVLSKGPGDCLRRALLVGRLYQGVWGQTLQGLRHSLSLSLSNGEGLLRQSVTLSNPAFFQMCETQNLGESSIVVMTAFVSNTPSHMPPSKSSF